MRAGSSGRRAGRTAPPGQGFGGAVGPPSGFPWRSLPGVCLTPVLHPPGACPQSPGGLRGMRGSLPAAGGWAMGASFPARASTGCRGRGLLRPVPRKGGHRGVLGGRKGCGAVVPGVAVGCFAPFRGRVGNMACPTCASATVSKALSADAQSVGLLNVEKRDALPLPLHHWGV